MSMSPVADETAVKIWHLAPASPQNRLEKITVRPLENPKNPMILRESFETHYCLPSVTFKLSPDPMGNRPVFNHLQIAKNGESFVVSTFRPTNDSITNRLSGEMERPVFVCREDVYLLNIKGFLPPALPRNSD